MPGSGRWRYSLHSSDPSLRLTVATSGAMSLHLWRETWSGAAHWSSPGTLLEVEGNLEGELNLELRGEPGAPVEGTYAFHCGKSPILQTAGSVETYQWYYRVSQGQVVTYPLINRFPSATSITIRLSPLDSSCDPDLFVFKGKWSGKYDWKSERGYGDDSVTISASAALKDITGAYTIEVHGGVPGPYVLRVFLNNAVSSVPARRTVASDNVEEYFWYLTVATDATDYYFFQNRFKNTVEIAIRLTPLSAGDPDLRVYKGQWTGVYDWVSSAVRGEELLSIKPSDPLLQHKGIVGDYAIEVRGVFAATYRIGVTIYYNNGPARQSSELAAVQRDASSFLFERNSQSLIPGSIAFSELPNGASDSLHLVRVEAPTTLSISVTACLNDVELLVPTEQRIGPVTYEKHRGVTTASFFVEDPALIRAFVSGTDSSYAGTIPYRVVVQSDETSETELEWETLGSDKLVVTWPPLRLSGPGSVRYRVALGSVSDSCGLAGQDLELATSVPTAVLTIPEDVSNRAVRVIAEVQGEDWAVRIPYLHREIEVEGWHLMRLGVLIGLVIAVCIVLYKRKGASWTEVHDEEVYRRLIEERD